MTLMAGKFFVTLRCKKACVWLWTQSVYILYIESEHVMLPTYSLVHVYGFMSPRLVQLLLRRDKYPKISALTQKATRTFRLLGVVGEISLDPDFLTLCRDLCCLSLQSVSFWEHKQRKSHYL